jgi:hypothetical protein
MRRGVDLFSVVVVLVVVERGQFPARATVPPLKFYCDSMREKLLAALAHTPSVFLQSHLQRIK